MGGRKKLPMHGYCRHFSGHTPSSFPLAIAILSDQTHHCGPKSRPKKGVSLDSCKRPKQVFNPQELQTLDLALTDAMATIDGLGLKQEALLRDRLFAIARNGVTDPISMRNMLLKSIDSENDR
jgi:hypothetical protein